MYYFDETSHMCRGFHFTGCGKSRNIFPSKVPWHPSPPSPRRKTAPQAECDAECVESGPRVLRAATPPPPQFPGPSPGPPPPPAQRGWGWAQTWRATRW